MRMLTAKLCGCESFSSPQVALLLLKNEFPSKVSPEEEKNSQSYQHDFGYCEVSQLMIDLYHPKLDRKNQNVAV